MRFFFILLLTCLSAGAQEAAPPDLLVDAGQCLGTSKQDPLDLAHRKAATVELGSVDRSRLQEQTRAVPEYDTRPAGAAHRVEQVLYVVDYFTPDHSEGAVFPHSEGTVFPFLVAGDKHHRVLRLLFTVRFRQVFFPDDVSSRIELVDPPYGGIGTRDEIISAIRQIAFATFRIPVTQLQKPPDSVSCEMENESP